MDTTLPSLLLLKNKFPKSKIKLFYTRLNKTQVTRNEDFYKEFLKEKGIIQLDLSS